MCRRNYFTSIWQFRLSPGWSFASFIACLLVWWFAAASPKDPITGSYRPIVSEDETDVTLQRTAAIALAQREGAIIVMDPQTGRVRAVVNPQVAFEESFAPGSTIKPFVALAALRAGLIEKSSRTLCREHYSQKDFATVCAHPRNLPAFNLPEAIGYSCNYYFGTLGERLGEESLADTLASFGFGRQTGINAEYESPGTLLRGRKDPRNSLGEGEHLKVTSIQLITAYSALLNGGRLLTPRIADAQNFAPRTRGTIIIATEHRDAIVEGMRDAVKFGTAKNASPDSLPLTILGKTGTSTPTKGFRSQGWFVGFASDSEGARSDSFRIAVLVFLKKGHGADAAEISRPVLEEFARLRGSAVTTRTRPGSDFTKRRPAPLESPRADSAVPAELDVYSCGQPPTNESNSVGAQYSDRYQTNEDVSLLRSDEDDEKTAVYRHSAPTGLALDGKVRVHLVHEKVTREISIEAYVSGVVAAEGSTEDQPEALKALAIASRTYMLKNLGRHGGEGFDFCTKTHCQRFRLVNAQHPTLTDVRAAAAVSATAGEILTDERGQIAEAYFSASCGGVTANISTLWGASGPSYLRGGRDEYCQTMPHHSWTDVISSKRLLGALSSDARTDPGTELHDVSIVQRDDSGRAESIVIQGARRRVVSGWDFKIVVGRALGWNLLKSSRFEITRSGWNYVFRGSGFGHGLGLCQEGAHVMAQRGMNYRQILAKYFPGTSLRGNFDVEKWREGKRRKQGDLVTESRSEMVTADSVERRQTHADLFWSKLDDPSPPLRSGPRVGHSASRAALSSEHFRVSYPASVSQRDAEQVLRTLEVARADLLHRVSAAGVAMNRFPSLEIFINDTTGDFVGRTGQPWWAAAATKANHIELQPIEVLQRRGVLATTLRHELVHLLIDSISNGHAPHWLSEGMALHFAGEGPLISRYMPEAGVSTDQIEQMLNKRESAAEMRAAYAAAYREVRNLIRSKGEVSAWRRVAAS